MDLYAIKDYCIYIHGPLAKWVITHVLQIKYNPVRVRGMVLEQ